MRVEVGPSSQRRLRTARPAERDNTDVGFGHRTDSLRAQENLGEITLGERPLLIGQPLLEPVFMSWAGFESRSSSRRPQATRRG